MNSEAYELVSKEELADMKAMGYIFRHKKTHARVVVISNDDTNKVFTIGFRTPPNDDTGVPHIMEHSVLCGSKSFPAKDPFVELAKGSLNTFLNAMTYSDKTVYPIASYNDKDFQNLMHVYLDAVFYPNIYIHEEIMKQEGWHYELNDVTSDITYNGVVYNEMKGVFSDPEQQLMRYIQSSLLPHTNYACESGGDPAAIPKLTYEQFLNFHRKYYHPSNSYIYLYGNMDVEEKLTFIDEQYLNHYEYQPVASKVGMEPEFATPVSMTRTYSLADSDEMEKNTFISYNAVIGTSLDQELYIAFQILQAVLLDMPGAPLKQALIDAKICSDVAASYDNGIAQPIFSIVGYNANSEDKQKFETVIRDTLQKIVKHGIGERALLSAFNHFEFQHREANFGRYPKGLMYGLQSFDSWLYDDKAPFLHLQMNDTLEYLKAQIENGYYERIIKRYLLDNPHRSIVMLEPERGLNQKIELEVKEKLADYKSTLSQEQLEQLVLETEQLKQYQEKPTPQDILRKIPLLSREDINPKVREVKNRSITIANIPVVAHDIFTNGIGYLNLCFQLKDMDTELYPYTSLLVRVLGNVDTEKYTYNELAQEIGLKIGGFTVANSVKSGMEPDAYQLTFHAKAKMLYQQIPDAFEIIEEVLFHSKIQDRKRLREIIAELKSNLKPQITSSGHMIAAGRAMSYISASAAAKNLIGGYEYYTFIDDLNHNYDEKQDEIVDKLEITLTEILRRGNLIVSYTGDNDVEMALESCLDHFSRRLSTRPEHIKNDKIELKIKNEGFKTASKVQYVATAGNFKRAGYRMTGSLHVLETIFAYDYLWERVRVKGGAYGCMFGVQENGNLYYTSYRDPKLLDTYQVYCEAPEYVRKFNVDERDMTKYIIGTIGKADAPLTPSAQGEQDFNYYLLGISDQVRQNRRNELLATKPSDIQALAPLLESIMDNNVICVIGNENIIEENRDYFSTIVDVQ